jgi:predicted O-methyltransferase YrrM
MVRKSFPFWQNLGVHVVPNHYYQPIPDTRTLSDRHFERQSEMVGINMNESMQLSLLSKFGQLYKSEYDAFPKEPTQVQHEFYLNNRTFASVDAEMLYCMIRHLKPKRVYEIGSGFSTCLAAQAILENKVEGAGDCELVAIEPYPNEIIAKGFPGLSKLMKQKLEDIPFTIFSALSENDILFIDSSHILKMGSDVQYEYLELLPRINPGVIVHVHDIFLPAEYPKEWMLKHQRFWNEQYVLQAFLSFNESFEVLWGSSFMHLKHPKELQQAFTSYDPQTAWPGSFWMQRVK